MKVKDLLNTKDDAVYSVPPQETVYNAIAKMADLNIGALIVLKNDRLTGIISERDYRNKVILKGRTSKKTQVKEIMTSNVFYVEPTDSVNFCMQVMTDKKIRHLPVLDQEKVIGMISIGDVVKSIIKKQENEIDSLRTYISSGYPG